MASVAKVSNNDGFALKTEKSFIKNEELCIKNKELCIKNEELCFKTDEICKGVTARGVAAAAGAGLGIGFRGDLKEAARQAGLHTQRDHHLGVLERLRQLR